MFSSLGTVALGNMSVVCLGWYTMTYTGWLFLSECSTSLLWQSIVVFGTELQGISSTTVSQSLKLLIASTCDLPDVINCQFREFAAAPLRPVHFCRRTKSLDSLPDHLSDPAVDPEQFNVCALEVSRNRALQINIYLLTYLLASGLAVLCFRSL